MSRANDVLEMGVVRGVRDVVGEMCMARGGWELLGLEDWVWALPILWEHRAWVVRLCFGG